MQWPTAKSLRDVLNAGLRNLVAAFLALLLGAQAGVVPQAANPQAGAKLFASCSNNPAP